MGELLDLYVQGKLVVQAGGGGLETLNLKP